MPYCLFDTAFGHVGLAWSEGGITRLQLPEKTAAATERRLLTRAGAGIPANPPPHAQRVMAEVLRYFEGDRVDFASAMLDLSTTSAFHQEIYTAARRIAWGDTTTYGGLAKAAGYPDAARAVGQAMGSNPVPVIIPCHRVQASGGKSGGFSAYGGAVTKDKMLALEGVCLGTGAPRLPGL